MFLKPRSFAEPVVRALGYFFLWMSVPGCSAADSQEAGVQCFADIAVYDPNGSRLPFSVTRLNFVGSVEVESHNLLGKRVDGISFSSKTEVWKNCDVVPAIRP